MTPEKYIGSGDLEAYCLGDFNDGQQAELMEMCRVFPAVRLELDAIERSMLAIAEAMAVKPRAHCKNRLLSALGFAAETLDLTSLPLIDADTDYTEWLSALSSLIPVSPADEMIFQPLTERPDLLQTLVYTRLGVPEETHSDFIESFFILEGTCTCLVGGQAHALSAGDFLEIPLHTDHDIVLTSPYVLAILQRQIYQAF